MAFRFSQNSWPSIFYHILVLGISSILKYQLPITLKHIVNYIHDIDNFVYIILHIKIMVYIRWINGTLAL